MATLAKTLVAAFVCISFFAWAADGQTGAKAGIKFELRLADENAGKDLTQATVEGTTRKVYLHKEVLLTNKDIAGAKAITVDDKPAVEITFTETGAKAFAQVTERNDGKRLALMLDGQVLVAPVVRGTISNGIAQITGNFTREEAEKIASGLKGK